MKRILILGLVLTVGMAMPLLAQEKQTAKKEMARKAEMAKEKTHSMTPPKALDDEWSRWMVGEWEGWTESGMGKSKEAMTVAFTLDNQFLMTNYKSKMVEMTPEQMAMMKEAMSMSDEDVEKMKTTAYKGFGLMTVHPKTGEVIGYWFDSWRSVYRGKGKREGNKQTVNWEGPMGTSTRTVEKVDDDKMIVTFKETMPGGKVMEGRSEFTRKQMATKKY